MRHYLDRAADPGLLPQNPFLRLRIRGPYLAALLVALLLRRVKRNLLRSTRIVIDERQRPRTAAVAAPLCAAITASIKSYQWVTRPCVLSAKEITVWPSCTEA